MFWLRREEVSHPTPKRGDGQRRSLSKVAANQPHSWPTGGKTKLSGWRRARTLARVGAELGIPTTGSRGSSRSSLKPRDPEPEQDLPESWFVSAGVWEFGIPPKLPLRRQ